MSKVSLSRAETILPPDIGDQLEVFLYTNLSTIVSPNPDVLLTPRFQAALTSALNDVGVRHNIAVPSDLKDIFDVFIVMNAGRIV
ncbi:MAG: hypothetical protein H6Q71_1416 [Firmicutes bacterium]|nr:hypothetical protein [Bacillota bacterium]